MRTLGPSACSNPQVKARTTASQCDGDAPPLAAVHRPMWHVWGTQCDAKRGSPLATLACSAALATDGHRDRRLRLPRQSPTRRVTVRRLNPRPDANAQITSAMPRISRPMTVRVIPRMRSPA